MEKMSNNLEKSSKENSLEKYSEKFNILIEQYNSSLNILKDHPLRFSDAEEVFAKEGLDKETEYRKSFKEQGELYKSSKEQLKEMIFNIYVENKSSNPSFDTWDIEKEYNLSLPAEIKTNKPWTYNPEPPDPNPRRRMEQAKENSFNVPSMGTSGTFSTKIGGIEGVIVGRSQNGETIVETSQGKVTVDNDNFN